MNTVILHGNLTRDPEIKEFGSGGKQSVVANFTIATHRFYTKANGEKEKDTEYIACEAWDTGATTIGSLFKKGDPILVKGSLKNNSWEDSEGNKRSIMRVRVNEFEKLARFAKQNDSSSEQDEQPTQEPEVAAVGAGEDIPF